MKFSLVFVAAALAGSANAFSGVAPPSTAQQPATGTQQQQKQQTPAQWAGYSSAPSWGGAKAPENMPAPPKITEGALSPDEVKQQREYINTLRAPKPLGGTLNEDRHSRIDPNSIY